MRCACAKTDRVGACVPQEKFAAVQRCLPPYFDASKPVVPFRVTSPLDLNKRDAGAKMP
ncbi:hypothetical protein ABH944_002666 [Caballeronia udeis]|uniref:Uncharacterized protein n=1 Tax=Caballeronia udeis TaxID=1232866 RepID=A0ABW8MEW9_9BURK